MNLQSTRLRARIPLLIAFATAAATGQVWLQATFATVRHPVSLGAANTMADPETVRAWYEQLIEHGTLDRMVATELVDLVWIVGLAGTMVMLTLVAAALLERRNPAASRRLVLLAPWAALPPASDLVENSISLVMLSDPLNVSAALVVAHATVSWVKVAAIVAVGVALPVYALWAAWIGGRANGGAEDALSPRVAATRAD
jgi:hypothetical protein